MLRAGGVAFNHFASIGFGFESDEELQALSDQLIERCEEHLVAAGRYLRYATPCGAELWYQVSADDELIGLTPYFAGTPTVRVRLTGSVERGDDSPLDGALHAWMLPPPGEAESEELYPFVFECPDLHTYGAIEFPVLAEARIAAFAHDIECFRTAEEFRADGRSFAEQSFVPTGLFAGPSGRDGEPNAEAFLAGYVRSVETRTNPVTRGRFVAAEVETYGGTFHVVAETALLPERPVVGGIVSGSFWLCGRLTEPPPTEALGSTLRRLLRRSAR